VYIIIHLSGPKPNLLETNEEKNKSGFGLPSRNRREFNLQTGSNKPETGSPSIDLSTFKPYDYGATVIKD